MLSREMVLSGRSLGVFFKNLTPDFVNSKIVRIFAADLLTQNSLQYVKICWNLQKAAGQSR